jgi:hypothetical protein
MKVKELVELLSKLNPEAEVRIGGWKEHSSTSRYVWDRESLQEKNIEFSRNVEDKLTVHFEFDV